ncbi:MAG TPA: D-2-hydroxyacid dehydrogenase, partial [Ktedonobacterales bacterium]|nr:D-2-hydroxyacid dehydrogenase [Ktedonobacterales bacterium]
WRASTGEREGGGAMAAESASGERMALVNRPWPEQWLARLRALAPGWRIVGRGAATPEQPEGAPIADDAWRAAEVAYTWLYLPTPEQAPALRWVQLFSAGADLLSGQPLFTSDVTFTTASGVHAICIAEHVFTTVLAWNHRLPRALEGQRRAEWPDPATRYALYAAPELWGQTMGILGYGSIGRQVARLATAFGMRVLALQRGDDHRDHGYTLPGVGDPAGTLPARFYAPGELRALLAESDVVVVALPLTDATRHLLDAAAFAAMKPSALFVNIARGDVCDEAALVHALTHGQIAAALLDVFHDEPLPPTSPLWALPNVILTPHTSGFTPYYEERAAAIFTENLRRYLAGELLLNAVDRARGY